MTRFGLRGAIFGIVTLGAACAVGAATADVIAARQANFKQIAKANKAIGDELKNAQPSVAVLQANARTIATLAPQIPNWFPAGSGPESGVQTAALPTVWARNADFRKTAAGFAAAARTLNAAAASGNVAQVQTVFSGLGGNCKACHDSFRARK